MRRLALGQSAREEIAGWLFASPWIIGFFALTLGPTIFSLATSFTRYDLFSTPKWVGLDNYVAAFTRDRLVLQSLKVTTFYAIMSVPLNLAFGFALALLLNQKVKGLSLWRTIFYLPSVVSGTSVLILWLMAFHPQFGLFNSLLAQVGIKGPNWLGAPEWAVPSFVMMSVWDVGSTMLIYLAGLQGIPTELYDAAQMDGASDFQRLLRITLPMMSPVILFNLIMGIIRALQSFNTAYWMTQGGPAWATYFFMLHIFRNAFGQLKMGYASALAWVLLIYILLLTVLVIRRSAAYVHYEYALRKGK